MDDRCYGSQGQSKGARFGLQRLLFCLILFSMMLPLVMAIPLIASNITDAEFYGQVQISNNASAATNECVNFTLSTQALIDGYYINSACNNSAIRTPGGVDIVYMPAPGTTDQWIIFLPSISENATQYQLLYTGGGNMSSLIRYFPSNNGMSTNDSASLELGNNFSVVIHGYFDASSGSGKYVANKTLALEWWVSSENEFTAMLVTSNDTVRESQTTSNSDAPAYGVNWLAQTFQATANYYITSVDIYGSKTGNPSGNADVEIRAVSGGLPTGTALATGSVSASSFPAGASYINIPLTTPYLLSSGTNYSVVFSVPDGNATNLLYWRCQTTNPYSDGQECTSSDSGSGWSAVSANDMRFRTYGYTGLNIVGSNITTGEHTLKLTADGTDFKMFDGDTEKATVSMSGASMFDNANNWTFFENGSAPYIQYQQITVNGTLQQHIIWENNESQFTDQSGNGNHATPTFRTTSTNSDIAAALIEFGPIDIAELTGYSTEGNVSMLASPPEAPGEFVGELNTVQLPGASFINNALAAADIPQALFWFPICFGLAALFGFIGYGFTKSLLVQSVISAFFMFFFSLTGGGIIPWWSAIIFIIEAFAVMIARKQVSW